MEQGYAVVVAKGLYNYLQCLFKSFPGAYNALNLGKNALRISSNELLLLNSRCGGGYADLPWHYDQSTVGKKARCLIYL
jgi:hypothetical protein